MQDDSRVLSVLRSSWTHQFLVVALLVAGAILRLAFATKRELWLDETYSAFLIKQPFWDMFAAIRGDVHPPLYYLGLRAWSHVFSDDVLSLRAFSIVTSLFGSYAFYRLALTFLASPPLALIGLLLLQFSPALIVYSVEVRMYILAVSLLIAAGAHLTRAANHPNPLAHFAAFLAFCALSLLTHYVSLFVVLGLLAAWVASFRRESRTRMLGICGALVLSLCFAPWLPTLQGQRDARLLLSHDAAAARDDPSTLSYSPTVKRAPSPLSHAVALGENVASLAGAYPVESRLIAFMINAPILLVLGLFGLIALRGDRRGVCLSIVAAATSLAAFVFSSQRRYLLPLVPCLLLCMLLAVQRFRAKGRDYFALLLLGYLILLHVAGATRLLAREYCKPMSTVVGYLKEHAKPGELIVFHVSYLEIPFEYSAGGAGLSLRRAGLPVSIREWWTGQPFTGWGGPIITHEELNRFVYKTLEEEKDRVVWLLVGETYVYDPGGAGVGAFARSGGHFEKISLEFGCSSEQESPLALYRVEFL